MTLRQAWLQKHPSPSAAGGEFHWHPPEPDRELRASLVERLRGIEPPAVLWRLAPGHVAWAQLFAATAPVDRRSYVGMVLTVVERDGARPAELLAELTAPPAAPWQSEGTAIFAGAEPEAFALARGQAPAVRPQAPAEGEPATALARSLISGGSAAVADPARPGLAALLAQLEQLMPPAIAERTREGACTARRGAAARDPVAELAAAAWRAPTSRAAQAWQLLGELAGARGKTVDDIAREVAQSDRALRAALTARELELAGTTEVVGALHAWGRGRLDASETAATLTARLADVVALRVLGRLVRGDDAGGAIAEARWHALLPAERRRALLDALAERAASLRAIVEGHHA